MRSAVVAVLLVGLSCVAGHVTGSDEWPEFRGPGANGHADGADLPLEWSEDRNVLWKTAIPGEGHSSPVISGDQIWLTTAIIQELTEEQQKERLSKLRNSNGLQVAGRLTLQAVCVSRESGKVATTIDLFEVDEPQPKHSLNSYASPTPIIDGHRVYFHFGTYGTAAVDARLNKVVWRNTEHQVDHQNGPGASPALWRDRLIINYDGIDTQYVAALETATGRTLWTTKRSGEMDPKAEFQKAYCTPTVIEDERGVQVISPGANWVYSYDPESGRERWKAAYGMLGFSTVPRPVFGNGLVFVSTSFIRPRLLAVRYDGAGDVTKSHIAWQMDGQMPRKPSMLLIGDELYFTSDSGIGFCLNARTGEELWKERLQGNYSASPLFASGRIYFFDQAGRTVVIAPGRNFRQLAENFLDAGFMASPAVAGNALFLRTETHLYRIENE
ncbi:MAG: outer membrane protein assembly factor BamB family protein [Planctomycetota bacterium]|jgi:outer membrane protein assembly factor BamB